MNCVFCQPSSEYEWLHIKTYKFWRIELRSNQNYLGWSFIVLNRHVKDLMDTTSGEQKELFEITKNLRDVIRQEFHPDSFNYASLGNQTSHVHLQVIPRYAKEVVFQGISFKDLNWRKNYSPWDRAFDVARDVKEKIRDVIKKDL